MDRIEFLTNFIYESERIAQLYPNYIEIRESLKNNKQIGHVGAILYLEKRSKEKELVLTEEDVKFVHELIFNEVHYRIKKTFSKYGKGGMYEEHRDLLGVLIGAPASLIPQKMENLISTLNKHQNAFIQHKETINMEFISNFHYHFALISPFSSCNELVNRALLLYLLWYFEKTPFIIPMKEREEYLMAFQTKNPQALSEYFEKKELEISKN